MGVNHIRIAIAKTALTNYSNKLDHNRNIGKFVVILFDTLQQLCHCYIKIHKRNEYNRIHIRFIYEPISEQY